MKALRLVSIVVAIIIVATRGNAQEAATAPAFDKAVIEALYDKVLQNSETYTEDPTVFTMAIEQSEGLLNYFAEKYTPEQMSKAEIEIMKGNEPLGAEDTDLFRCLNKMSNILYGQDAKMDDATKAAYAKMQEHRTAVVGR